MLRNCGSQSALLSSFTPRPDHRGQCAKWHVIACLRTRKTAYKVAMIIGHGPQSLEMRLHLYCSSIFGS